MLSIEDVQRIHEIRERLQALDRESLTQTRYPYGRFGEACRAADDALFQVLLVARHWLEDDVPEPDEVREEEVV